MHRRFTARLLAAITALLLTAPFRAADEYAVPQVRLPLLRTAPTIDGTIDEAEWANAARMVGFCGTSSPLLTGGQASFWVGCDGTRVFIAVLSETPPGGKLLAGVMPAPQDSDARVWQDDSIELVFDPLPEAGDAKRRLYHAILNAKNAIYDQRFDPKGGGEAWRGHWEMASQVRGDRWHFEVALPLADLGVTTPEDLRQPFGIRVCRNWKRAPGPEQSEWAAEGKAFLAPETMPRVTWDAAAPVVQVLQVQDAVGGPPRVRVAVRNPHAAPVTVAVLVRIAPQNSAPKEQRETVTVPPGETREVTVQAAGLPDEDLRTRIEVTAADGATVYYRRDFAWRINRPEPFFQIGGEAATRLGFDLAYYPSHATIKARLDISGLEEKDQVKGASLALRRKGDPATLATTAMPPLQDGKAEIIWKVPVLGEGEYEVAATLDGPAGLKPVVKPFVRHVFPWEGNRIGTSDILFPPFTPIVADPDGKRVSTVLRTHSVNGLGLWDQVEADGLPLLKGPMRLEVTAAGRTSAATGAWGKWTEKRDTRAVAGGTWEGAPLHGTWTATWDYDGFMEWTLEIAPGAAPVDAVTLTIPLAAARCPLMHACTDGIRINYAGAVPAGEGRVWDGSKAARNSMIGSFVPYLWVGEEGRGLCFAAENDRGWVTDPAVPCQELVRRGDTLELVCHLIAVPTAVAAPRTLRFALQATPAKPMPADWRRWNFGSWRGAGICAGRWAENYTFLGSCWYWGTLTPYSDYYPVDADMSYIRKMAETRRTGEADTAFIEQWLHKYDRSYAQAKTAEDRAALQTTFRNHVEAGFHCMKGKPQFVCFYTNGRGVRFDTPEGQTFIDEWYREAYAPRDWGYGGAVAYDMDPVASFRDYAAWYFKQMAELVLDTVYWDDLFYQSNFDVVAADGYRLPDGNIQPSMGLHNMREYVRRTAVMYQEMGRPVRNIVHMTNTAITPVLSFAQMNYTWEDKSGDLDFQDRFSRDYIRAESLGLQQGNVPFCLWLVNGPDKAKVAWAERTGVGVMLTHEIKTSDGPEFYWELLRKLLDFGYGKPDVAVSNYWQKDHPLRVEGSDCSSLLLSKPGAAVAVVCDWGDGGDVTLRFPLERLGLAGALQAKDVETEAALEATADGTVRFPLKRHDFKVVMIEAARP
jgi:hypothetical protein